MQPTAGCVFLSQKTRYAIKAEKHFFAATRPLADLRIIKAQSE